MDDLLQIGIITSTHGIKGEVKVFPTTDDRNRFQVLKECYIEFKDEMLPVKAAGCRFFKNMVILKFEDFNDINKIEKYKQCRLFVDREHAVPLGKDEYFAADLMGLTAVKEDGSILGSLTEIIPTGANDVYVITDENKKEYLLPAIKECILKIDMENRKMAVHLMKGMEE